MTEWHTKEKSIVSFSPSELVEIFTPTIRNERGKKNHTTLIHIHFTITNAGDNREMHHKGMWRRKKYGGAVVEKRYHGVRN